MITADGTIKIIDFGLAATPAKPCRVGVIVGSPCYIAPEILNNEPHGPAADLFSVGAVIYTSLFNDLPFIGETAQDRIDSNTECQWQFPPESNVSD
jgi:serine/threonine protein kinase